MVRLPPLEATYQDYDLGPQAQVQNAVAAGGVQAPAPALVVTDPSWIGSPFLVMPLVHVAIAGPAPVFDEYVNGARPVLQRRMHDALIDTMAAVHAVSWQSAGLGEVLTGPTLHAAVRYSSGYVEWASEGEPLPALVEALAWCSSRLPAEGDAVL